MPNFGIRFQAKGVPAYDDVSGEGQRWPTYEQAEIEGSRYLAIGNWLSFTIEKRYYRDTPEPADVERMPRERLP